MNSEWKCADRELSHRLKELGVRQDKSERVWAGMTTNPGTDREWYSIDVDRRDRDDDFGDFLCAAYDGSELGVALPVWYCSYRATQELIGLPTLMRELRNAKCLESHFRAHILIWLLEKGHVDVADVNRRLAKCLS